MNNTNNTNNINPKYLIIVTLVDGQNFTIPDGVPDKIEATVFAEARFGSESVLRSDPIKLVNSNPEFSTELAWQLDRKSLHQLRIERRAIKLQVFMQTKRKKTKLHGIDEPNEVETNSDSLSGTNKIELIGYTVIKIRSAQESEVPKFEWLPLLNPKFRKSSYNRPEVQLALTLTKVDENLPSTTTKATRNETYKQQDFTVGSNSEYSDSNPSDLQVEDDSLLNDSNKLYKTCLDMTQANIVGNDDESGRHEDLDEIIDNDIQIHSKGGNFYIYDIRNLDKFTIDDCDKSYRILVTIPFNSDLDLLLTKHQDHAKDYYFSINLFGSSIRMKSFDKLTRVETAEIQINVYTTHSSILTTYFELNPSLVIRFHHGQTNQVLGLADIQVDQLCSVEAKRRSVEGIFALQPASENEEIPSPIHPTIGVSVVLEKSVVVSNGIDSTLTKDHIIRSLNGPTTSDNLNENFGEDIDELLYKSFDNTHQLTLDESQSTDVMGDNPIDCQEEREQLSKMDRPISSSCSQQTIREQVNQQTYLDGDDSDHHFCFTIDLKNFSYTREQRLIPTLRELVVRYSYPFFGYKDTITTDASIPISPTNSIIVSGFCEFNFATTYESLLAALNEIPLHLKILTCDHISSRRILETGIVSDDNINSNGANQTETVVATCNLNLAEILDLPVDVTNAKIIEKPISKTISAPIFCLNGEDNGQLQVYLCLKDLGRPTYHHNDILKSNEHNGTLSRNFDADTNQKEPETNHQEQVELNEDYIKDSIQGCQSVDQKSATITKYSANRYADDYQPKLLAFMEEVRIDLDSWRDKTFKALSDDMRARESEIIRRIQQKFEIKDSKREQEFKDKMRNLNNLEKRFKTSLSAIDSLEKMLRSGFEQLKKNNSNVDVKLETIETKISKAISDIKLIEQQQHQNQLALEKKDDQQHSMQPAPQLQQPAAGIVPPAKKLSFYPSKYSRSSEGNLILSANSCDPPTSGLVRKTGQLNHITQSSNISNGISRAGSNTRISSGVTVIDVSPGGTRRPSLRQATTKWSANGTSTAAGTTSSQTRTSSTSRIGSGHIPRVR